MMEDIAFVRARVFASAQANHGNRDYWRREAVRLARGVVSLQQRVEALERDQCVVWEGDEGEGRWRCLMCGEKREGEDDTGPEGIDHHGLCGEAGQPIWAYGHMMALAAAQEQGEG